MSFKPYDILSALIPGFIVLLALLSFFELEFNKDYIVPYTAIGFLIGFMVNALSSWFEDFYYFTWGGKPSDKLLDGKCIWKIKFHEYEKVKEMLKQKCGKTNPTNDNLFAIAMRYSNSQKDSRVPDFNANYVFARALLTTMLIVTVALLSTHFLEWKYYAVLIPILIIIWLRCKQRAYYYVREVLNEYLKGNE